MPHGTTSTHVIEGLAGIVTVVASDTSGDITGWVLHVNGGGLWWIGRLVPVDSLDLLATLHFHKLPDLIVGATCVRCRWAQAREAAHLAASEGSAQSAAARCW